MEDQQIISLYQQRNETAISETDAKYAPYCRTIAFHILQVSQDVEECISDTWLHAWNHIPPELPQCLRIWLGRITRNLSLDYWRKNHAKRRYQPMELLLSELDDCVPVCDNAEKFEQSLVITQCIERWLDSLSADDRILFVKRYWHGAAPSELAKLYGMRQNSLVKNCSDFAQACVKP